jgi:hypothetical protein
MGVLGSMHEKRQVMQFLDTVIEHEKLRRKVSG